jgi:fructose-bisphosphate aldolase class I
MDTTNQITKVKSGPGFIAALDQSGGSTPKALELYGISESAYSDDDEMFALMHEFRTRIITSPSFGGDHILGAIMFEDTMNRQIDGRNSADYLWKVKGVVPFVKVDKGLAAEADGVQIMKPMPDLDRLLERARGEGVFGTKMRSFIKTASPGGIKAVVDQQFELARRIVEAGLVPIIEPEVDIHSKEKDAAEMILEPALRDGLSSLGSGEFVMLKLTLPSNDDFYSRLVNHHNVLRVLALSGGYSRDEANARLARNRGVVASFSRALTEGLSVDQSDDDFNEALRGSIASIFEASNT